MALDLSNLEKIIANLNPDLCEKIRLFWIKCREKISKCHHFVPKGHLEVCRIIKWKLNVSVAYKNKNSCHQGRSENPGVPLLFGGNHLSPWLILQKITIGFLPRLKINEKTFYTFGFKAILLLLINKNWI